MGNNGVSVTAGTAQLGVDCSSSLAVKVANRLTTNRMIHMGGNNMIFADGGRVGIGVGLLNCTVGNKLEVTSGTGMPYWPVVGTNGSSGLRLTRLTSLKTPVANGTNGVDSCHANGCTNRYVGRKIQPKITHDAGRSSRVYTQPLQLFFCFS